LPSFRPGADQIGAVDITQLQPHYFSDKAVGQSQAREYGPGADTFNNSSVNTSGKNSNANKDLDFLPPADPNLYVYGVGGSMQLSGV